MKKIFFPIIMMTLALQLQAQITKATLQATGLTCAMCSNAINKALQKVPFVESVKSDIRNSAFSIVFKENGAIDIDILKNAVEDAGFSIGSLQLTGTFNNVAIANDKHIQIGTEQFHFLNVDGQTLEGVRTLRVVDKSFVTAKEFKKISASTKMSCLQTRKTASCCIQDGIPSNIRIYHVTI